MKLAQRAIALIIGLCLVVASSLAEAWIPARGGCFAASAAAALRFQTLSQPADAFGHNGTTETATVKPDYDGTLE